MNIFVSHEIYGFGGDFDFVESSYSVLSGIVSAKAADYTLDGLKDLVVVADGSRTQTSYTSLPPTSYLFAGVDIDDRPLFDVSPNIWAGGSKGASTAFSFSAWGIANPRGYPSAHTTYVGSDVAWLENDGAGNFILKFVTSGGKPALTYGAKSLEIGNLDADFYSEFVVFSDTWPVQTGLGNSSVMRYDYAAGTFNEFSVSTPTAPDAQGSPRAGTCAKVDSDNFVDILVANHDNSPYLYWFKNPGTGIILDSHYQPVNVSNVDISTPQIVWAGKFDADAFNDIVVGRDLNGSAGRLTLLRGTDGTGTNFSATHITASPWPVRALAVTDMNGDGLTDIVAGGYPSGSANPSPLTIFFSQAGYVGWTAVPLPNGGAFSGQVLDIQVADFNNDTIKDVVALFSVAGPADGTYAAQGKSSNVHLWSSRNSGGSLNQWFDFGLAEPRLPASAYAPGSTGGNLVIADFDSRETTMWFAWPTDAQRFFLRTPGKEKGKSESARPWVAALIVRNPRLTWGLPRMAICPERFLKMWGQNESQEMSRLSGDDVDGVIDGFGGVEPHDGGCVSGLNAVRPRDGANSKTTARSTSPPRSMAHAAH